MQMQLYIYAAGIVIALGLFLVGAEVASAQIPQTYTNQNFWSSEHDRPVSFWQDSLGNFFGTTTTGKTFSQTNVENTIGVRLQKFAIDEAFFYVSDKGTIRAESDLIALSIYLTRTV